MLSGYQIPPTLEFSSPGQLALLLGKEVASIGWLVREGFLPAMVDTKKGFRFETQKALRQFFRTAHPVDLNTAAFDEKPNPAEDRELAKATEDLSRLEGIAKQTGRDNDIARFQDAQRKVANLQNRRAIAN